MIVVSHFRPGANSSLGLALSDVYLTYGGAPLFAGFAIELQAGRTTCLLGPSGVGKTSLLRTLAGLGGGASAATVRCSDGLPAGGRIAWMDQRDQLLPWLDVTGNVMLGARLRGEPADRVRAQELLALVGLQHQAGASPQSLSGGMRQRVALARTLYEDRPVVLLDEPFAALDAITRHRLQQLTARLFAGRTAVLVTHDPVEALVLGDVVHVLAGRPVRIDATLEPPGPAPRDPTGADIAHLHRTLLDRLAAADQST